MPYTSDKQRRYLHAKHPGIAAEWDEEIRDKRKKKRMRLSDVSKSMVRLPSGVVEHAPIMRLGANGKYERAGITRQVRRTVKRNKQVRLNNNLPPQGARGAEAKVQYLAQRQSAKDLRAAQRSAGQTPRGSQSETMTAEANRKRQAASRQQRSVNQSARAARKIAEAPAKQEAGYVKGLEHEYRNVKMARNQKQEIAGGAAILTGAGGLAALQAHHVKKAAKDQINTPENRAAVAGGVAGIGASQIALQGGGFGAKKLLAHRRKEALKDPAYRKTYNEEWHKHLKSRGLKTMTQTASGEPSTYAQRTEAKLHTPTTLKDWRGERALAFKNLNPVRHAVKVGTPVVGGTLAYRAVKRRKESQVGKSLVEIRKMSLPEPRPKDERKRKGAATGVGAVAVGTGLVGGGVPGMKAKGLTVDVKHAPALKKPGALLASQRAGHLGYRENAHHTLVEFDLKDPNKVKGKGVAAEYARGLNEGKQVPEKKIISHMRRGKIGSNVLLAGGVGSLAYGLHRKKKVTKADDRRNTALLASGGTVAGGSLVGSHVLNVHGRKWAKQAKGDYDAAGKIIPNLGTAHPRRTSKHPRVPEVRPDVKDRHVAATPRMLAGKSTEDIQRAAHLRGKAAQGSYFSHVYGTMGKYIRRGGTTAGVGLAGVGGARLMREHERRVKKALKPTYFGASAPTERLSGENQRYRTEAQHQTARGVALGLSGASTGALAARWAGHKHAPVAIGGAAGLAASKGVPPEMVRDATKKAMKLHRWAAPKRGRLLLASGAASAGALGAGTVARWKKDEITGISQDLGRATAGDRGSAHGKRVVKSAATAIGIEYGTKGAKRLAEMSPAARKRLYIGTAGGVATATGGVTSAWAGQRARRVQRENKELKAAGGLAGPVMKCEVVGFGKALGGSNVREYSHLPENIRSNVAYGSIGPRRNPMSALDLFAASRIMTQAQARATGSRISNRRLTRRAHNEMNYAGGRAMLYSPTGRGSAFL